MRRACQLILVVVTVLVGSLAGSTTASASTHNPRLSPLLTEMWTHILVTPAADNPFGTGSPCTPLAGGRVLAPFPRPDRCVVEAGTKLFVVAYSAECSNVEAFPYYGGTEAEMRQCARDAMANLSHPKITIDGRRARISTVETDFIQGILPEGNLFSPELAGEPVQSVGYGWATLVPPLSVGKHTVRVQVSGTDAENNLVPPATTDIYVKRHR